MKFKLRTRHYMFDRLLEEQTIISTDGFQEIFGDKPKADGEWEYGILQKWTTIDGKTELKWHGPPSQEMEPLDKEAEVAKAKHFAGRSTGNPIDRLPTKAA